MAEKKILIERQELDYEGVFDLKKLYLELDQYMREHGYDRYEHRNYENVTEKGGEVYMELRPWKRFSDYAKGELVIELHFKNLKDIDIEKDGIKQRLLTGRAHFQFQGRMITDYEDKWESTPVYQFMRTFTDKFVRKTQTGAFEKEIKNDIVKIIEELRAFLNLFRYKV